MVMEPTFPELYQKRDNLASELAALVTPKLKEFSKQTGVPIQSIDIRVMNTWGNSKLQDVNVVVKVYLSVL
jgi:hypothetical protein